MCLSETELNVTKVNEFSPLTGEADGVVVLEAAHRNIWRRNSAQPVQSCPRNSRQLLLGAVVDQNYLQQKSQEEHMSDLQLGTGSYPHRPFRRVRDKGLSVPVTGHKKVQRPCLRSVRSGVRVTSRRQQHQII